MAHCIFCSMHLISFSLKWRSVSRVIFLTFLIFQFNEMLCSLLYLAGPLLLPSLLLSLYEIRRTIAEENYWEQTYQVAVSYHQISFPGEFLQSLFRKLWMGGFCSDTTFCLHIRCTCYQLI